MAIDAKRMPLSGVRIVTVEEWLQLPWATVNLAEMGAEVIRVESLGRMVVRNIGPYPDNKVGERFWNQGATYHNWYRSKKSLTLDLRTPDGAEAFKELVAVSDVVAENNRAGIMERFGLTYDVLRQVKPDLIMLRSTGYGQTGEWRSYGAFARTVEAMSSLSHMTGFADGPPVRANTSYVDITTSWNNMLAVMMALHHRNRTGEGAEIDMSMYETGVSNVGTALLERQLKGTSPERMGNQHPWVAPHGCYPCAGIDKWVTLTARDEREWRALCDAMGQPKLADDPRFSSGEARWEHRDELDDLIESWTSALDHVQVMHILQERGVPAGAVLNAREVMTNPHFRSREFFERSEDPPEVEGVGTRVYGGRPYRFSRSRGRIRGISQLGEHNGYALRELLGMDDTSIAGLVDSGIVGTVPTGVESMNPQPMDIEGQLRMEAIASQDLDYRQVLGLDE